MSEKKVFKVTLSRCDDSTSMRVELSGDEHALIERLCAQSEEVSNYGCMPTMSVEPWTESESDDD